MTIFVSLNPLKVPLLSKKPPGIVNLPEPISYLHKFYSFGVDPITLINYMLPNYISFDKQIYMFIKNSECFVKIK